MARQMKPPGGHRAARKVSASQQLDFRANNQTTPEKQARRTGQVVSGGKASRRKGHRFERSIVDLFQAHGLAAERIPLSGSAGGSFTGDVSVPVLGIDRKLEAKIRSSGFGQIRKWLIGNYAVIFRADRSEPLVTLRLTDFAALAISADKYRAGRIPPASDCGSSMAETETQTRKLEQ